MVAPGLDPGTTQLGTVAEEPHYTIGPDVPLEDAFRLIEERDAGARPVWRTGRLVGVLSRAVLNDGSPRTRTVPLAPAA